MLNFLLVLAGAVTIREGDSDVQRIVGSTLLAVGLNRTINQFTKENP